MGKIINRFPEIFAKYKEQSDISQVKIAIKWGIDPSTLSKYATGKHDSFTREFLELACTEMGVTLYDVWVWQDSD